MSLVKHGVCGQFPLPPPLKWQGTCALDQIINVQSAIRQYQVFMPEFDVLRQFIYTFRKRLEDLYFIKTDIHLLSLSTILYKRHLVRDLFAKDVKN